MIPRNGFGPNNELSNAQTFKSLKTENLQIYRNKMQELQTRAEQESKSKSDIQQYQNIKSVLLNFSFDNLGHQTLCMEVIENVLDELRRERKIEMVLADDNIEKYIELDFESIQSQEQIDNTPYLQRILSDKAIFRERMCQKISVLKPLYIFRMLKKVFPDKASMLTAEAFKQKVIKIEAKKGKEKRNAFKQGPGTSYISNFSATDNQKNAISQSLVMKDNLKDQVINDPILQNVNLFVQSIKEEIEEMGSKQLKEIENLYRRFQN